MDVKLGAWLHKLPSDLPRLHQEEVRNIHVATGTFAAGLAQSSAAFIKTLLMRALTAHFNTRKEPCKNLKVQVREGFLRSTAIIPEDSLKPSTLYLCSQTILDLAPSFCQET